MAASRRTPELRLEGGEALKEEFCIKMNILKIFLLDHAIPVGLVPMGSHT